jgi:hypothetical protein
MRKKDPQQIRMTDKREEGKKGETEETVAGPRGEKLLRAQECDFAGSGGFGFCVLDFEFVSVFEIGISDFRFGGGREPRLAWKRLYLRGFP